MAETPRRITYDWFLLALDLLYAIGTIELEGGLVARRTA
ncbi:ABC-three component system middle component 6 [Pseudomonas aeruginosa]